MTATLRIEPLVSRQIDLGSITLPTAADVAKLAGRFFVWVAPTLVLAAFLFGPFACDRTSPHPNPNPGPVPPGPFSTWTQSGREYRADLATAAASALEDAAKAIRAGKPIAEAKETSVNGFRSRSQVAFDARFRDQLKAVLPEGTEPSESQRQALSGAFEGIAAGLRTSIK